MQDLATKFFESFAEEYLPTLQQRTKWLRERRSLQVDDIVLVADEELVRGQWPLGIVTEPIVSEDGRVRQARVRIGKKILIRPASKLIHLEVDVEPEVQESSDTQEPQDAEIDQETPKDKEQDQRNVQATGSD